MQWLPAICQQQCLQYLLVALACNRAKRCCAQQPAAALSTQGGPLTCTKLALALTRTHLRQCLHRLLVTVTRSRSKAPLSHSSLQQALQDTCPLSWVPRLPAGRRTLSAGRQPGGRSSLQGTQNALPCQCPCELQGPASLQGRSMSLPKAGSEIKAQLPYKCVSLPDALTSVISKLLAPAEHAMV